jgi:hypothetical protein
MKTLTITKARQNLGDWLGRALRGEDIGIIHPTGEIVALRPTKVYSEDYGLTEYGLTQSESKRAVKNINKASKGEKSKRWDGTARGLRG